MHRRSWLKILVLTGIYFGVSVCIIPFANERFQRFFDSGYQRTMFELITHWVALILSFPLVIWALFLHPARINKVVFILSVLLNGILWSAIILWATRKRGTRSGDGSRLTART